MLLRRFIVIAAMMTTILFTTDLFASGAGGIVSNNNQSAEWVRTLNRYASTDADAVFFNPAGTAKLADGTHIGFSNQAFFKYYNFNDDNPLLPREDFNSYVLSPVFPNFHVVQKKENMAYMFGFDIMTGGGAGTHDDGIPFSDFAGTMLGAYLPASEQGIPIESLDVTSEFSGYFVGAGLSIGAAYAVNDIFSIAGQLRYVYTTGGNTATITPFLNGMAQPTEELDMSLSGDCLGVIFGANIMPTQALNIGLRYSYYTKMELEQKIHDGKDLYGQFAERDGQKADNTIPQDIAFGVSYDITPRWRVETSFIFYYNEGTDWSDERGPNIENGWEAGVGLEYAVIPDKLLAGIGYLYSKKGLPDELQSDISAKIDAITYGLGATYYFKPTLDVTFAYLYSWNHEVVNHESPIGSTQRLSSNTHGIAVGFNVHF